MAAASDICNIDESVEILCDPDIIDPKKKEVNKFNSVLLIKTTDPEYYKTLCADRKHLDYVINNYPKIQICDFNPKECANLLQTLDYLELDSNIISNYIIDMLKIDLNMEYIMQSEECHIIQYYFGKNFNVHINILKQNTVCRLLSFLLTKIMNIRINLDTLDRLHMNNSVYFKFIRTPNEHKIQYIESIRQKYRVDYKLVKVNMWDIQIPYDPMESYRNEKSRLDKLAEQFYEITIGDTFAGDIEPHINLESSMFD